MSSEEHEYGAAPRLPIDDVNTGVIKVRLQAIKESLDTHFKHDEAFQATMWSRVGKLTNLRFYAAGIIVAILAFAGIAAKWGPWVMKMAVVEVVSPQMKAQAEEDQKFIGAKLDRFKESVDDNLAAHSKAIAEQAKRIERLEARRERR